MANKNINPTIPPFEQDVPPPIVPSFKAKKIVSKPTNEKNKDVGDKEEVINAVVSGADEKPIMNTQTLVLVTTIIIVIFSAIAFFVLS